MGDPENGSDNLRSLINLEILRLLRAHQIEIPYPQRVIHAPQSQAKVSS
jgi:small-conductance mechanosensitive channel